MLFRSFASKSLKRGINLIMNKFRLPDETRIGQVHLQVSDLERALSFYGDLLGFKTVKSQERKAVLSATGQQPGHIILSELPGAKPKPPRTTGLFHVAIRFPQRKSLAQTLQRLIERRYPLHGFSDHAVSEAIYLADPDGNGVELYSDRPREAWPMRNGQVEMVTEPLDVENLLKETAGGGNLWKGIDPGTDIGHVHLRVSDLAKARRFYHEILGLDITQQNYPGALFLSAGGYHHHLGLNIWGGRNIPPPPADAVGLLAFSLEVPGESTLDILRQKISEAGLEIESPGTEDEYTTGLAVRDDDGNRVILVSKE